MLCHYCYSRTGIYRVIEKNDDGQESHIICKACHREMEKELRISDLPQILSRLIHGVWVQKVRSEIPENSNQICPACQTTWSSFRDSGQLGCDQCYNNFRGAIRRILSEVPDAGRGGEADSDGPLDLGDFRRRLQKSLDHAVAEEAYEKAAVLRDKMQKLTEMAPD